MKPIVWITFALDEKYYESFTQYAEVRVWNDREHTMPQDEFEAAILEADIVWMAITHTVSADLLQRAKRLKMIANVAVGYNNIDVEAAKQQGILVTNTPGVLTDTTADLAFSLLLTTARRIVQSADMLYKGKWDSWELFGFTGQDVHHKKLGIFGMGAIGELVAKRAKGFDMEVLYHNRNRKEEAEEMYGVVYKSKEELLQEADFVLLLMPLTEETRNFITKDELALMKQSSVLINVARGGIVNEDDLYDALVHQQIAAAASDVFVEEPVPTSHPLLSLDNFVATPHIGSATKETRERMASRNVASIIAYLQNESVPYRVV